MATKLDKQRFAKNGYNDKPERNAFIRDMKTDSKLKEFIYDYFNLHLGRQYHIKHDPLGEYAVDLAIIDKGTDTYLPLEEGGLGGIMGLVEVDVLNEWTGTWPHYYYWCHRLGRKTKYYEGTPYPYVNISYNTSHTEGVLTTRETEIKYPIIDKWFKVKKMWDKVREVPVKEAFFFKCGTI
tara:strand:+ start:62 stop:604 length:543 start_codon:yes stop_codon:yes gene_type:complete